MKENKEKNIELENIKLKNELIENENKRIDKKNLIIKIIIIIAIITVVCVIVIKMISAMTSEDNKNIKENDKNINGEISETKDIEENNKYIEKNITNKSNQKKSDLNNKNSDKNKANNIKNNKDKETTKPIIKSKWDIYDEQRNGKLGKNVEIEGYWRCLGDIETVWRFDKDKFWWYKSYNNYKDNYWNGSVQILKGKKALKEYGIDYNKIGYKFSLSEEVVSEKNIYAIICNPDKIIINGIDKGKSNIQKGTKWRYLWIIIEHGSEGIEAQAINMETQEKTYYFKTKDK